MIEVYSRCQSRDISPELLDRLIAGWEEVFQFLREIGEGEIRELGGIEVTLLDDDEMSRLHGEFLDDATSTDVITFDHGELLIGVEVAARQAGEFGSSPDREIALYGIHGMLHLSGYDDRNPDDARLMAGKQEELLGVFFAEFRGGS